MFENLKSAPVSAVLKELLEGKKLTREQQMQVLENRREILVRCMKTFSQKTLGQLACLDSGDGSVHELRGDEPRVVSPDDEFSLDTRGFYAGNLFSRTKSDRRLAFGIDNESWILVEIEYSNEKTNSGTKYEKATSALVFRTDLRSILDEMELTVPLIWSYFDIITEEWVSHRRNLYYEAYRVAEGMKKESILFNLAT